MDGPDIITRTLSQPAVPDKFGNLWQYHSRSDRHSKVACWAVLYDLLQHCNLLAQHVYDGKVVFGINRTMRDFRTGRTKDLDLVISRPGGGKGPAAPASLHDLALRWGLRLSPEQLQTLPRLPPLIEGPAGNVHVALEAKACMTAHIKALPRLFDELTSSYSTVHADTEDAIAVGFAMVNASPDFLSSDLNKYDLTQRNPTVNEHPGHAVARTITKLREINRRTGAGPGPDGFDAFGTMVVSLRNDGTPVRLISGAPGPVPGDTDTYEAMIGRVSQRYATTFGHV